MSWFSLDCKNLLDHNLANCNLILFGRLNLQLDHNLHSHKLIKVSIQFNTEKYISHISLSMPCCHKSKSPSLASSILAAQHMSCPERVFDTNCYRHKFCCCWLLFLWKHDLQVWSNGPFQDNPNLQSQTFFNKNIFQPILLFIIKQYT